ncbi:MAG: c-type cytochrome [Gammaproteobacteria bacterium]|nr:c-type cytochrome [Gammaproteobacteria bacterium]
MRTLLRGVLAVGLLVPAMVASQEPQRDIYADPQNLQVLPKEISSRELSETMKGFALGLGVRCETCHMGVAGKPLTTFDFASDANPMKQKARVMIKMLDDINENYVGSLDDDSSEDHHLEVRCVTCHRGQAHPELIEDVMEEQLAHGGVDAAVSKYAELRERYYGSHTFDFSEMTLPMYAQGLAQQGNTEAALALLDINAGHFPESYYTRFLLGEVHAIAGNREQSLASFEKAIELNPRAAGFLQQRIETVKKKLPE